MTAIQLRHWSRVHTWSSLICTVFMLLLCITGLPLIFHHQIAHLLGDAVEAPFMPAATPAASLDAVVATAQAQHPLKVVQYLFRETDEINLWYVTLGETAQATETQVVAVDARTAQLLAEPKFDEGFLHVMFALHTDLFMGLPGKLFLGAMGILLLVAIISGVVLYAPFMRRLSFGSVRRDRSPRLRWLDVHNLLGMVTLVWLLVVGATGVINTWADLVIKLWQADQMAEMIAPYQGLSPPRTLSSVDQSVQAALAREPDMQLGFIAWPGSLFSSPHHYAVFMRGNEPLTARLFKPVLVDAQTAQVTDSRHLPWYVSALLLSQPLHFGDYAGLPLQILWALLDILAIVVLWTGVRLWWHRRRTSDLEKHTAEKKSNLKTTLVGGEIN